LAAVGFERNSGRGSALGEAGLVEMGIPVLAEFTDEELRRRLDTGDFEPILIK
jgi:hypothetical protein